MCLDNIYTGGYQVGERGRLTDHIVHTWVFKVNSGSGSGLGIISCCIGATFG